MLLDNQKGMALFSVLIIVTVTTLLGTAVWIASSQETLATELDENQTQAYHFAHSGVEKAISLIKSGYCDDMVHGEKREYYGKFDSEFQFSGQEIENYNIKFGIELREMDGEDSFIIDSVGIVRTGVAGSAEAKSEGLRFEIKRGDIYGSGGSGGGSGDGDIPLALFANQSLDIESNGTIEGNVATNAEETGSVNFKLNGHIIGGNLYIGPEGNEQEVVSFHNNGGPETNIPDGEISNLSSSLHFPLPTFPEFPDLPSKNYDGGLISSDGYYNMIDVSEDLTILVGNEDVRIRTNTLIVQGNGSIKIIRNGTGRVIFYVEETLNFNGESDNNSDADALMIYYKGSSGLVFSGQERFCGGIYLENAPMQMSGNSEIKGTIISGGGTVTVTGGGNAAAHQMILYAPNSAVDFTGGGEVRGIAVAETCTVKGNKHDIEIVADSALDTTLFDSLLWGSNGPPSLFIPGKEPTPGSTWRDRGSWIKT